ncbi:MAG: Ig-like domain repeat protein [Treponema sp.]
MKTFRSFYFIIAVAFTSVFALTTCKDVVGLGGAVDINPPIIRSETIYPPVNAVIRDSFLVSVVVEDDRQVETVSALLTCLDGGAVYSELFYLENNNNRWSVFVDRSKDHAKYKPADGKYRLKIVAKDTSGKETEIESRLIIDNTPPLLVLQRPSTALTGTPEAGAADVFGDSFFLAGQVYDSCPVDSLELTAHGKDGKSSSRILKNIPQTIRMTVGSFASSNEKESTFYKDIYGTEQHDGNKTFSYSVKVTDSARIYRDTQNREGSGEGNSTATYYLHDDLYQEVLSKHRIDKVYTMMLNAAHSISDSDAAETARVVSVMNAKAITQDGLRKGAFTLNPSINPKYGIDGHIPKPIPTDDSLRFDTLYEETVINVKLSPNFDGDPLKLNPAQDYEFYFIDLKKYKEDTGSYTVDVNNDAQLYQDAANKTLRESIKPITVDPNKITKSGTGYTIPVKLLSGNLSYDRNYVLQVRGSDQKHKSHTMIADPKEAGGALYGFRMIKNGKRPEIKVQAINGKPAVNGRFYVKKGDAVTFSVTDISGLPRGSVHYKVSGSTGLLKQDSKDYPQADGSAITFEIPSEKFAQDKSAGYKLEVWAAGKEGEGIGDSLTVDCQIYYDVEGPVITVNTPGVVSTMPTINGDIYDAGCGVDFTSIHATYKYESDEAKPLAFTKEPSAADGKWSLSAIPTPKDGNYEITVTAQDILGTKGETTITFMYDTDKPCIQEVNSKPISVLRKGTKLETTTKNLTLNGIIIEKNKIKTLKIGKKGGVQKSVSPSLDAGSTDTYRFNHSFNDLEEGDHTFVIEVEDAAGKTDSAEITAVVDTEAPQFKRMKIGADEFSAGTAPNPFTSSTECTAHTRAATVSISGQFEDKGRGVKKLIVKWKDKNEPKEKAFTAVPVDEQANIYKAEGAITVLHGVTPITCIIQDGTEDSVEDGTNRKNSWQVTLIRSTEQLEIGTDIASPNNPYKQDDTYYVNQPFTLRLRGKFNGNEAQGLELHINKDNTALSADNLTALNPVITKLDGSPFTGTAKNNNTITGFKSGKKGQELEQYLVTFTPREHLDDGRYVFTFKSSEGDLEEKTVIWVDTKAPVLTPRVPVNGQSLKEAPNLFAVVTDTPGSGIKEVTAVLKKSGEEDKQIALKPVKGGSLESVHTLPLVSGEGEYTIIFTYKDYLDNAASKTVSFNYDKTEPVLSDIKINGKDSDTVLIGTQSNGEMKPFKVKGNVQDTVGMKAVYALLTHKATGNEIGIYPKKIITGKEKESFEWDIVHSMLTGISPEEKVNGLYTLSITAEDAAGSTKTTVKTFVVDRDHPTAEFTTPELNSTVNKIITVRGTASDTQKLKSVTVFLKKGDSTYTDTIAVSSISSSGERETTEKKVVFTGDAAAQWSFDLDTAHYRLDPPASSNTVPIVLKIVAEDEVGNKTEKEHSITVDQHTDRPTITINSFEHIAPEQANLAGIRVLTGKVEDDDGIVDLSKMKIGIDTRPLVTPTFANGVWKYIVPSDIADGQHSLHFEITDKAGTLFTTAAAADFDRPYVLGYDDNKAANALSKDIKFCLDTVQPQFKENGVLFVLAEGYADAGSRVVEANTILGNKDKQKASFKVLVKDASGIKKVTLQLGSNPVVNAEPPSSSDSDGYSVWVFNNVQLTQGEMPLVITATDKADFDAVWQQTVIVDFEPPVANVRDSILNAVYYLNADIVGTVKDGGLSGISGIQEGSIEYKIGNSGWLSNNHIVGSDELSTLKQNPGTWEITIPDVTKYKNYSGVTAPSTGSTSKIYTIPVQVKMKDRAGNEGVSPVYTLQFDPAGSTPIVELITPDNDASLGTSVAVTGIARTAKPVGFYVKKIEVQLRQHDKDWGAEALTIGGKNFGQGCSVIEAADESHKITYWQYTLQAADIKTALLHTDTSKTLYIRTRGISSDGTVGAWTPERKFSISKDVAEFSPFTLGKTAHETNPPAYAPRGVWIKGDTYTLKGSVTHSGGIKTLTAKTENVAEGVQALNTADEGTWYSDIAGGKAFAIPIKTSGYTKKSGEIEFTITAEDNRTGGQSIKSYSHVRLKYDNSVPAAAVGTPIGEKTAQAVFTAGVCTVSNPLKSAEKDRYRIVVNNVAYEINSIEETGSGKKLKLKNAAELSGTFDYGIVEHPHILQGLSYQVEGLASDMGSGIAKIAVKLTVKNELNADVSKTLELKVDDAAKTIFAERGDLVYFKGSLNTTEVPNGKGTLKITAYDGAGNEISDEVQDVLVKNSPLSITKLTFNTNLDGNASYDTNTDEVCGTVPTGGKDDAQDYRGTVDVSQIFTYKDNAKSELVVELDGGYKTARTFELYKDSVESANKISVSGPAVSGNKYTFNLAGKLNEIGDGAARKLILKVFDESVGKLWYAQVEITVKVEHTDTKPPVGVIIPFFYNTDKQKLETEQDFKLTSVKYDAAKKEPLGHIELSKIDGLDSANPSNAYPSVSGTVMLRGTAYDNVRIKELKLSGAEIGNGAGVTVTNNNSSWSGDTSFKIVSDKHNRKGHYVAWEYEWKTGTPALAQTIILTVTDTKGQNNKGTAANPAVNQEPAVKSGTRGADDRAITLVGGDTAEQYQFMRLTDEYERSYLVQIDSINAENKVTWSHADVPSSITKYVLYGYSTNNAEIKVNIVPYITKVETALSKLGGNQPDLYARTALGRYPVQDKEEIKIYGFNLKGAAYTVGGVSAGTNPAGDTSPWTLTLAAGAKSGQLEASVTVTSSGTPSTTQVIKTINNSNKNAKLYNRGAKTANNQMLTDDVELDIWQFNSKAAQPKRGIITEPIMRINPASGMIGFAFANGPDFFSMSNGITNSYTKWHKNYDDFGNVDFVYGNMGTAHGVVVGQDINSGLDHGGKFTYMCSTWGIPGLGDGNNYNGDNALRLEAIGQWKTMIGGSDYILDKTRIQHPSLAVSGDNRLYLAYYDSLNDQIRFKSGINTNSSKARFGQFTDQETGSKVTAYNQANVDIVAGQYKGSGSSLVNTGNTTGTYLSLGVVSGQDANHDVAVLIWFDETERTLKYTYKTKPQTAAHASQTNPTATGGGWHVPVNVFDQTNTGEYCKIAVDKNGGIHIAAFDSDAADLKYAYLSSYNAAGFKTSTVDAYGITGTHITLDVAYTNGTAGIAVPYIGYYSPSAGRSKLAYLHDTATGVENAAQGIDTHGYFTGKWEISVIPTASRVQQDNINVGVWKDNGVIKASNSGTSSSNRDAGTVYGNGTANPVLGYAIKQSMNGYIETAQKK